jgi:regulator of protease activity HflC (stomatin/prohibitin superfamily)
MKETVLNVRKQEIISKDNASVEVDAVAYFQVMDAKKVTYVVNNIAWALENIIMTNVRTVLGSKDLDQMLSEREDMNRRLLHVLDEATDPWGVKVIRVEIKDITPPRDLLDAMGKQMKAEREKRARILEAQGKREAAILEASGKKEAAILDAEGEKESQILEAQGQREKQIVEAEGYKEAQFREAEARERLATADAFKLSQISEAIQNGKLEAVHYSIAREYIESLGKLTASDNSKTIMLPVEATNILGSLGGISELLKNVGK